MLLALLLLFHLTGEETKVDRRNGACPKWKSLSNGRGIDSKPSWLTPKIHSSKVIHSCPLGSRQAVDLMDTRKVVIGAHLSTTSLAMHPTPLLSEFFSTPSMKPYPWWSSKEHWGKSGHEWDGNTACSCLTTVLPHFNEQVMWEENLKGRDACLRETPSANAPRMLNLTQNIKGKNIILGIRQLCRLIFVRYWTSENGMIIPAL